jgi:acyl-homoserine-lactone acylase
VRPASLVAAAVAILAIAAPSAAAKPLEAKIQRTKYGVPHITAKNIESLAAGFAYAFAQDNICTIAAEYVTVNAERSRFFGPDETWFFSGNGSTYKNLDADFYFQWVKQRKMVEKLVAKKPPDGPTR